LSNKLGALLLGLVPVTGFNLRIFKSGFGSLSVIYFGGVPPIGFAKRNFDLSTSPKISLSIVGL
jgi:hypothetical protein